MTDGDFVFENRRLLSCACVQHAVVLHVGAIADADVEHVAAHDCAKPNRRLLADVHVANDLRAVSYESGFLNLRVNAAKGTDQIGTHDSGVLLSYPIVLARQRREYRFLKSKTSVERAVLAVALPGVANVLARVESLDGRGDFS